MSSHLGHAVLNCSLHNQWGNTKSTDITFVSPPKRVSICRSFYLNRSLHKRCEYIDLHNVLVPYEKARALQKAIVEEKKALVNRNEECLDTLIVLQHPPVYTLGAGSSKEYLNFDIENPPCDVFKTERGGEVTYHGPGQLVMYPIINLRNHKMDLHWYLRTLEEVVIRSLFSTFSIEASRIEGLTGVWFGNMKLAAIGIRVTNWITYHGLALNVSVDLTPFQHIVPCGIRDREVGSISQLLKAFQSSSDSSLNRSIDDSVLVDIAHNSMIQHFTEIFGLNLEPRSPPDSIFQNEVSNSLYDPLYLV